MTPQWLNWALLVEQQAATVQARATNLVNVAVGTVFRAILEANASVALWFQWLLALVLALTRAATSTGPDLDTWQADFSFARLPAAYASGTVTFARNVASAAAFVPVGSTVKTTDGTQQFAVVASASALYSPTLLGYTIPAGTASAAIPVLAVNAGTQGNVAAGTIALSTSALSFIDTVGNTAAFTNGVDPQSDANARTAFVGYINTRTSGIKSAVQFAVSQIAQNLTNSVVENATAGGVYAPGTFVVWVDDGSGTPPATTLATCYAAIDLVRPIGSTFSVLPPVLVGANISFGLVAAPGYTVPALDAVASLAVAAFVRALPMGAPLPYSRLAAVIYGSSTGIANVVALTLNGAAADIGGQPSQVVRVVSIGAG